jgi:predicted phosphoribosyltransferase
MYFKNRAQAGKKLARKLEEYRNQDVIVIALSEGAAIVAAQVAMHIHSNMLLFLIKDIMLPGEHDAIAGLGSTDTFVYNSMFSAGQLEEMTTEFHQYIDQERINKRHEMNVLMGHEGQIDKKLLRHRVIILVSDGLSTGSSLNVAGEYLKTVAIKKLVVATPLASVAAVDRMHLVADEIACLSVTDNYMFTDHYYDDNTVPGVEDVFKVMRNISVNWER